MEKAYDFKELGKRLKVAGLIEVEDGAEACFDVIVQWVKDSAVISKTPYDDMAMVVFPQVEKLAKEAIDKIDGQEG